MQSTQPNKMTEIVGGKCDYPESTIGALNHTGLQLEVTAVTTRETEARRQRICLKSQGL